MTKGDGDGAGVDDAVVVGLSQSEAAAAATCGAWRAIASRNSNPSFEYTDICPTCGEERKKPKLAYANHIQGALGEMAVAKYLDLYWPVSVNRFRDKPDLGDDLEVRSGFPKVRPGDDADQRVVFVTMLDAVTFRIDGWIEAGYAQSRPDWKNDPHDRGRPCFVVPEVELRPPEMLRYGREREGDEIPF